jgi:hypothetical protein
MVEENRFPRAIELEHPLVQGAFSFATLKTNQDAHASGDTTSSSAGRAGAGRAGPLPSPLPDYIWMEMFTRYASSSTGSEHDKAAAKSFALRLQNTRLTGPSYQIDSLKKLLSDAAGGASVVLESCVETTLSMQQPREQNDKERMVWQSRGQKAASTGGTRGTIDGGAAATGCDEAFVLAPLEIRAFTFSLATNTTTVPPALISERQ